MESNLNTILRFNENTRAVLLQDVAKKVSTDGSRRRLKVLNDTKLVLNEYECPLNQLGSNWYYSESSDVSNSPNQFLGWDFFCRFLQQDSSTLNIFIFSISHFQ
jgi:hypothetical protein